MNKRVIVSSLLVIAALSVSVWPPLALAWRAPTGDKPDSVVSQGDPPGKVEPLILKELAVAGQTDFIIWMTEKADLSPAYRLGTKQDKGRFVFETLRATAERTQKDLRASLDRQGIRYESFYIANKILVHGGNPATLLSIAARPDVAQITANHAFQLEKPIVNSGPPVPLADAPTPVPSVAATLAPSPTATPSAAMPVTTATRTPTRTPIVTPTPTAVVGGRLPQITATQSRTPTRTPTCTPTHTPSRTPTRTPTHTPGVGPNITFINADQAWALGYTGQDTVLAGNDTGLDETHPAIARHYRGCLNPPDCSMWDHNYNWWDATGTYPTDPYDGYGHGTHTTGTMVGDDGGDNQIGVAPGARTIHCKNLTDSGGGNDATIATCFQWDLAPWDLTGANPRPDLAPDAINNSWGYGGGNAPQFEDEIAALQAAGIVVEFSAGNAGPSCATLGSPGDYRQSLTSGSVSHSSGVLPGTLTEFSSRGPSDLYPSPPDYLPDIMAPGEHVRSSLPGNSYAYWSGTSMAGPHTTALIGLMWSANPALRGLVTETVQIIQNTAVRLTGQNGSNCGGDYSHGPNNDWGYGTIDALAAVQSAMLVGGVGNLAGAVTDSGSGHSLAGASISASQSPTLTWRTTTNALGSYALTVFSGTYSVTAGSYGYYPEIRTGVQVTQDSTTTLNLQLDPAPSYVVSGTVRDAAAGWPLYARIQVDGYPYGPIWNNPVSGFYSITLAAGITYTFNITAWVSGYDATSYTVGPLTDNRTENIALAVNTATCDAPGYRFNYAHWQDFEAGSGGYSVSGTTSWAWGAPTSGPGSAHSGAKVWATNLSGSYNNNENGYITSPSIDLSAYTGQPLTLNWWQWLQTEDHYDFASAQVSNNGGSTWNLVYGPVSGNLDMAWAQHSVALDSSYAVSGFRVRFHLTSDYLVPYPGWYVDDAGIATSCDLQAGGLVVGNTYDANTALSLAGAMVSNDSGYVSTTRATVDPAVDDSFYTLFSPAGSHVLTATHSGGYAAAVTTTNVVQSSTVQQDLHLPAGRLSYTPLGLQAVLDMGQSATVPLTLTNMGAKVATFQMHEADRGFTPLRSTSMLGPDVSRSPEADRGQTTLAGPAVGTRGPVINPDTPNQWVTIPPNPIGVSRPASAVVNGKFYIIGGESSGGWEGRVQVYDPATGAWNSSLPVMLIPASNICGAVMGSDIYIPGGDAGIAGTALQVFHTASNTWETITTDPLPADRLGVACAAYDDKLYVVGGSNGSAWVNTTWVYNPAATAGLRWTMTWANAPVSAGYGAALAVGNLIFYAGMSNPSDLSGVYAYNPVSNVWTTYPSLQTARGGAGMWAIGDKLIIGGGGWNSYLTSVEEYDTSLGTGGAWSYTNPLNQGRRTFARASDPTYGRLFVGAGWAGAYLANAEQTDFPPILPEVPWLSESPISGTVAAGSYQPVNVTFDASVPTVTQPGTYHAQLRIEHDTPYDVTNVPVTMTVSVPPDYGKLTGTLTGLAHCDTPGAPLDDASVFVQSGSGPTWTLATNISGTYQVWLAAANSPLTITAGHAGYVTQTVMGVNVTAQQTATQNFDLRLNAPCIGANPNSMAVTLTSGLSTTLPLTLTNTGAAVTTFDVREQNRGRVTILTDAGRAKGGPGQPFTPVPGVAAQAYVSKSVEGASSPQVTFPPGLARIAATPILLINTADTSQSIQRALNELGYTFSVFYGSDWTDIDLSPYDVVIIGMDGGAVGQPGLLKIRTAIDQGKRVIFMGGTCSQDFALGVNQYLVLNDISNYCWTVSSQPHLTLTDPGHALAHGLPASYSFANSVAAFYQLRVTDPDISVVAKNGDGYSSLFYKGSNFPTVTGGSPSRAAGDLIWFINTAYGGYWADPSDFDVLKQVVANALAFFGDMPWLSQDPISGTLSAPGSQVVSVTFDAGGPEASQPGEYLATLSVLSNDPANGNYAIPVTMTVETPPTWGKLTGTITGLAHCDALSAPLSQATAFIQSGSGLTWTLATDSSGTYQVWLAAANSPLTITAGHAGYVTQTVARVHVTAQQTATQNFDLRLNAPCVTVGPTSLQANLDLGVRQTVLLTMTNTGAAATTFRFADGDNGFQPIVIGPYQAAGIESRAVDLQEQPRSLEPVLPVQGRAVLVQEDKAHSLDGVAPGPAPLGSGGPDPFGYTYKDSQEQGGPSYVWIEIAPPAGGSGIELTPLSGVDEGYYWPLPLPFAFHFYGTSYHALAVASNGTLYFEDRHLGYVNTPIPSSNYYDVNRFIAHLWGDLYVGPGAIYYQARADRFIIEYYQVSGCCSSPSSGTWEIILFANGNLLFQYKDVIFGDSRDYGVYATVGIQGDIMTGLQYSYNTAALVNDLAICFAYPGQLSDCPTDAAWLSESPMAGTLGAPATQAVSVTFDAGVVQQPGVYLAILEAGSADPVSGTYVLPVTMTVPAPPTWGQAHGRVYSLGYCDSSPALLIGAQVVITTSTGVTRTLTQPNTEPWSWWAAPGPMTITAYAPDHLTQTIVTLIRTGQGINQDIDLRWLHNCGDVVPSPVTLVLLPNVTTIVPISLTNRGTLPWTWALSEDSTWLWISGPGAGTVGPDSSLLGQLTIDTSGMSSGATYTALVNVVHDDDRQPNPLPLFVRVVIAAHKTFLPSVLK